jgi:hypothetical protein
MRSYIIVSAVVFAIVTIVNIVRLAMGWQIEVAACRVPMAASWIPVIVAGGLAIWAIVAVARPVSRV